MARSLKLDIPGVDWRLDPLQVREQGLVAMGVETLAPLEVEIGFGRGEFLLHLAENDPLQTFLGVEYSHKRTLKLARRLARTELRNVRLLEATAEEVLRDVLTDASVRRFWVNFPDPWPKKRHFKRRLFQPQVVARMADRLVAGGELEIATDHREYAEWIDEVLSGEPRLVNRQAAARWSPEPPPGRKATAYELDWRALGRRFHFFSYRRSGPVPADG